MRLTGVEYDRGTARKNLIASFRDRPMASRSDKLEIENSGPELSESEEAVEVEVTRPFVRNFPNQECAGARIFRRCEQTLSQARPSAKGEFQ